MRSRSQHRLVGELALVRPLNMLLVALAVVVGAMLCEILSVELMVAALAAALILGAGNCFNDYCDVRSDEIAHPERPIPSGKISRKEALTTAVVLFAVGLLLAGYASAMHQILALAAMLGLVTYSLVLSRLPIAGNLTIAALSGFAVIYGALAGYVCEKALWAAAIAAIVHLPRELFKDIQDMAGDRAAGRKTLPLIIGERKAATIGIALTIIAMIVVIAPAAVGIFSKRYGAIASLAVASCALAGFLAAKANYRLSQTLLKLALAVGIIALFVEAIIAE